MAPRKRKAIDDGGGGGKKHQNATSMRITRTMTIDGPRQAVINTVELLELILLHLPAKKVFACQRVSRQFRDMVATSAAIQHKLFLRPSGLKPKSWITRSKQPRDILYRWGREGVYFEACETFEPEDTLGPNKAFTPPRLNPLLSTERYMYGTFQNSAQRVCYNEGDMVQFALQTQLIGSFSWRNTFLTDPPCTSAVISLRWTIARPKSEGYRRCELKDPNGITLGALIDTALQHREDTVYRLSGKWQSRDDSTVEEIVQMIGGTKRKPAMLERPHSYIQLNSMVIPNEEEWETVV